MTKTLRVEETAEGLIAYCQGSAAPFSFLIGQRQLSVTKVDDERYLFSTHASHAPYILQFSWPDLTDEVASWGSGRDLEILAGHCKWEMGYQQEAHGIRLVPESLAIETLPTGRQFIVWCSAPVGDPEVPEPEVRRADASENSPDYLPATLFSGNASIRNGCELVLFGIQGLGTQWTPESVTIKATRIAFSTFFE